MEIYLKNSQICSPDFTEAIIFLSHEKLPPSTAWIIADILEYHQKRVKRFQEALDKIFKDAGISKNKDNSHTVPNDNPKLPEILAAINELDNVDGKIDVPMIELPNNREFPANVLKELRPFMACRETTVKEL
jgi:hypothetical protein